MKNPEDNCERCKQKMWQAGIYNVEGKIIYTCGDCADYVISARQPKRKPPSTIVVKK